MLASRKADELVKSFVGAIMAEDGQLCESVTVAMDDADGSDAEFWNDLALRVNHLQGMPSMPDRFSRGSKMPSRTSRLLSNVGKGCMSCHGSMACGCSSQPAMQ